MFALCIGGRGGGDAKPTRKYLNLNFELEYVMSTWDSGILLSKLVYWRTKSTNNSS